MPLTTRIGRALTGCLAALSSAFIAFADDEPDIGQIIETGLNPVLTTPLRDGALDFSLTPQPFVVDVRPHFTIEGLRGGDHQLLQLKTTLGTINAEFLATGTAAGEDDTDPHITVANFKKYLATDSSPSADVLASYDGTFIHRSAQVRDTEGGPLRPFVIQGGGFRLNSQLSELPSKSGDGIVNEFKYANTRGTIAMAKRGGDPDSATNQWFINMGDNSEILATHNNGGFTVFARVLGKGMDVADKIAALNRFDIRGYINNAAFTEVPLRNFSGSGTLNFSSFMVIDSARIVPLQPADNGKGDSVLTYSITNDNPLAATATLTGGGTLTIKKGSKPGRALITVRASEAGGAFAETVVEARNPGPAVIAKNLPSKSAFGLGGTATLVANVTGYPLPAVKWQTRPPGGTWTDIDPASTTDLFDGADTTSLVIDLSDDAPAESNTALALKGHEFRFIATQEIGGSIRTLTSSATKLDVTTSLAFSTKLAATTTIPLGNTVNLVQRVTNDTYPAVTYQWQRKIGSGPWTPLANSSEQAPSPFSGVTTNTLKLSLNGNTSALIEASLALDKSQFRCVATNVLGTVEGKPTTVRVTTLPVGFSAQPPATVQGTLGGKVTVTVTALSSATNTPLTYRWQRLPAGADPKNAANWQNLVNSTGDAPTRYAGVTTRSLSISLAGEEDADKLEAIALDGDQYRCVITNALGTATSKAAVLRVVTTAATLATHENLPLPGLEQADGRTFTATGLPKGLTLDAATGALVGTSTAKPGVYTIVVTIREAGVVVGTRSYRIEVKALSGNNAGGFEALLSPADAPHYAKLDLTIANTGAFTGKLTTVDEKSVLALRGSIVRSTDGVLTLPAPLVINRPGSPKGRAYILSDLVIAANGYFSAKLLHRDTPDGTPVEVATAVYIEDTEHDDYPGTPGIRLYPTTKTNPGPWSNVYAYNLAVTTPSPLGESEELTTPIPAGSGYAVVPITADGRLSFKGKLADGTKFTATLPGGLDSSFRLFVKPYSSAPGGVLSARLPLPYPSIFYQRHSIRGNDGLDAYWAKPALPKSANYKAGFGPLGVTVKLEPWYPSYFSDFGVVETNDPKRGQIDLVIDRSDLGASAEAIPETLGVTYKVPNAPLAAFTLPDGSKFTGKLNTSSGLLTGSFTLVDEVEGKKKPVTRKVTFEGTMLMAEEQANGTINAEGFALVPALPDAADKTARSVRIQLKQPGTPPPPPEEDEND